MTTYRLRRDGLQWRQLGDETVVVDIPESLYLSANSAGTLLWDALAQGATHEELSTLLVQEYGIGLERAHDDVSAFLESLRGRGLLEPLDDE